MLHAREDYNRRVQDSENLIPADEPVFLLRGQDAIAPVIVGIWADILEAMGGDTSIVNAARIQVLRMKQWQREHGSKTPDAPRGTI